MATDPVLPDEATKAVDDLTRDAFDTLSNPLRSDLLETLLTDPRTCVAVVTGMELRYTFVNETFRSMAPGAEILGRTYREVFPEAAEAGAEDRLRQVLTTGEPWSVQDYRAAIPGKPDATWEGRVIRLSPSAKGEASVLALFWDTTDRTRTEKALQETEDRFRSVLENTRDVIARVNLETGRYEYISPSAQALVGYSTDELTALDVNASLAMVHPDDLPILQAAQALSLDAGEAEAEYRQRTKNGEYIWVSSRMSVARDDAGRPLHRTFSVRDITERKRADDELCRSRDELERLVQERTKELTAAYQSLAKSEARYRDLYDQANDIIFTTDLTGNFTTANARAVELFVPPGMPVEEISFSDVLTPDSRNRAVALIERAVAEDSDLIEEQPWEFEARTKDGSLIHLEVKTRHVHENGIITGIHGVARDVTGRKKRQEELSKLSSAVERAGEGIFMLTLDKRYSYVNAAFCNAYGFAREDLVGKSTTLARSDRHPESFHDSLWSELQAGNTWSGRQTRKRKDGTLVEVATTIVPVWNASGAIIHYVGVERDVTEHLQMEQQLRQARKMEALGTLTGGIAHDFNNILAAMIGFAEMSKDPALKGSRREQYLERVTAAGLRGRELVRQMLTFSRKTEHEKKPLQLGSLVKEVTKLLRASIPSTISMRVKTSCTSDFVLADPGQIQQVLMNLCTNAAYAMRQKGGTLTIELSDCDMSPTDEMGPGPYLRLVVRDTGVGIPTDIIDKIFDPFFTTKAEGEGTGLGLSVVHGIVRQHDGCITVESEPERGSTFTVYFPKVAERPEVKTVGEELIPTGHERVLFIDDEEALAAIGQGMLGGLGYKVTSKTSSREALAILRLDPSQFDLLITDQTMPDITGIELAKEVLALRPDMPVILCTGFSHAANEESVRTAGIKAFVMKPLTKRELAKTIRNVLDG